MQSRRSLNININNNNTSVNTRTTSANNSSDDKNDNFFNLNSTYIYSVWLSFIPTTSILLFYLATNAILNSNGVQIGTFLYLTIITSFFVLGNLICLIGLWSMYQFNVYWRSALLCNTFLIGFMIANQPTYPSIVCFGYYMMCLSFFHLSEFVFTALFNNEDVTTDSFLLNHSMEYGLAALSSWIEYLIELVFVPSIKLSLYTRLIGLFLVLFGETFRKLAMYTAGRNFNHYVQEYRKRDHVLVKTGIYALVRHPSYFGWFYWAIGTQLLLANPICTILYTFASWKFFQNRIIYEEYYLLKFFGKEYSAYQRKVPSGVPFVKGYIVYDEETLD